jgi:hypothetical protein
MEYFLRSRLLSAATEKCQNTPSTKVLLFVYLRILFQPLRCSAVLILTGFKLLYYDWRGYLVAFLALVWVANQYMSVYNHLRLDIKHEQVQIHAAQKENLPREQKTA